MIVNTSPTAAAAYSIEYLKLLPLKDAFESYLQGYGPAASADIIKALGVDGRNHTRLRDLWMEGRVRKNGFTIARSTEHEADLWEHVPEGIGRMRARLEYWQDKSSRLLLEASLLPIRQAEAQVEVNRLMAALSLLASPEVTA